MPRRGIEPDVINFNAAISACAEGAQWERARALLDVMRVNNVEPDVISYNSAIAACENGRQWEPALALLDDMLTRDIEPNVICFNAAISACEKGMQWERALTLLRILMPARGVAPDEISFNAVIAACEGAGKRAEALEAYDEACEHGYGAQGKIAESGLTLDVRHLPGAVAVVAVVHALERFASGPTPAGAAPHDRHGQRQVLLRGWRPRPSAADCEPARDWPCRARGGGARRVARNPRRADWGLGSRETAGDVVAAFCVPPAAARECAHPPVRCPLIAT